MDKNMLKQFLQHFSNLLLTIFAKLTNTVPKLAQKFVTTGQNVSRNFTLNVGAFGRRKFKSAWTVERLQHNPDNSKLCNEHNKGSFWRQYVLSMSERFVNTARRFA